MGTSILCPKCRKRNPDGATRCQFCGAVMAGVWGSGAAPAAAVPPLSPGAGRRSTSAMAIASLVLGLLGLFSLGITALVGLILGIVGLRQIGLSQGRLQGQGLAIAGIVVSGLVLVMMLVFVPITAAILFPVFAQAREKARASVCISHLRQEGAAMMLYAQDYDGHWPRKENWCDGVLPYVRAPQGFSAALIFQCPSLPNQRGAQAYNGLLSSVPGNRIATPFNTAAVFDARGGWNLAGGPAMADPRHADGLYMLFTDGHVRWLGSMDGVVWNPGPPAKRTGHHRVRRHRR